MDESHGAAPLTMRIQERGTQDGQNFETDCTEAGKGTGKAGETAAEGSSAPRIQRTQGKRRLERWRGRRRYCWHSPRPATAARRVGPNGRDRQRKVAGVSPLAYPSAHMSGTPLVFG